MKATAGLEASSPRHQMNGKPVYEVEAKTVLNLNSGFRHKLLCDGPTYTAGSACAYGCTYCYVPNLMRKCPHGTVSELPHDQIVIRRRGATEILRSQLTDRHGKPKFADPMDVRVLYASPLVDVAANMELAAETVEACRIILDLTHWQIRLLSKSNLITHVAKGIPEAQRRRVIFGVSTGTLNDKLTKSFEVGTPLVSKRLEVLHWLQGEGYRTYAMVCPSLPQRDYDRFTEEMAVATRWDLCEHVWAEVLNARWDSFERTYTSLVNAGFRWEADGLMQVSNDKQAWEEYARATFLAHAKVCPPGKLRFLQYVTKDTRDWWTRQGQGVIAL